MLNPFRTIALLSLLVTGSLGAACTVTTSSIPPRPDTSYDWKPISANMERRVLRTVRGQTSYEILVYRFQPKAVDANVMFQNPPKRLEEWSAGKDEDLVINGGYFTEEELPTGRFIDEGKTITDQPYEKDLAGTVAVKDGTMALYDTASEALPPKKWDDLFETFPVLIHRGGKPGVSEDSQKLARRTVLAQDKRGRILVIVIDRNPVSLYDLSQILAASDLEVDVALNLDGGPSTGLQADFKAFSETILPLTALPIVLSFSERPQD